MSASYISYFNLIAPITTFLLGLLLVAGWLFIRSQKDLLWIAAGYILPAAILAAQSGLDNDRLGYWTFITTPIYIFGAWSIGHGIALRYNTRSYPFALLPIIVISTALLIYYSRFEPNLSLRIIILNSGILLAQVLALPSIIRSKAIVSAWDRTLLYSFMLFSLLIFCRIIVTISADQTAGTDLLTQSPYWRFLLVSSLFFGLWFAVILLATTVAKIMSKLTYERDHDPLTGLLNRRAFFDEASKHLSDPRRGPTTILTLDIDHFKLVNDTYGHLAGDTTLVRVATSLCQEFGSDHILARFGGEEFAVLLKDCAPDRAEELAQQIQTELRAISIADGPSAITASFGIAQVAGVESLSDALRYADQALYRAKNNGRDQIQLARVAS